jgi:hypothetical protein
MRTTTIVALGFGLAITAHGAENLRVYVNRQNFTDLVVLLRAEALATRIMATAGVELEWRGSRPAGTDRLTVVIDFKRAESAHDHPGALAYARPYEGVHIVMLFDRLEICPAGSPLKASILAHAMAHEITHALQGFERHSVTGVMKAHWDESDYASMLRRPLPFTAEDIDFIRRGLRARRGTVSASLPE